MKDKVELEPWTQITEVEVDLLQKLDTTKLNEEIKNDFANSEIRNKIDDEISAYMQSEPDAEKKQLIYKKYMLFMKSIWVTSSLQEQMKLEWDLAQYQDILTYNLSKGNKTCKEMQEIISIIKWDIEKNPYPLFEGYWKHNIPKTLEAFCSLPGVNFEKAFEQFHVMNNMMPNGQYNLRAFRYVCKIDGISKEKSLETWWKIKDIDLKFKNGVIEALDKFGQIEGMTEEIFLDNIDTILSMTNNQGFAISAFCKLESVTAQDVVFVVNHINSMWDKYATIYEVYCSSGETNKEEAISVIDDIIKINLEGKEKTWEQYYAILYRYRTKTTNSENVFVDLEKILNINYGKIRNIQLLREY